MNIRPVLLKNAGISLFLCTLSLLYSAPLYAQGNSIIAQGFKSTIPQDNVTAGALVSTQGNSSAVELVTSDTADRLVGVIASNALISLSGENQGVEVALSGTTDVLVSDINGTIVAGDKITASPVAGIGMKATANGTTVGTAQSDFKETASRSITDSENKSHRIRIGYVRAQIGIATYQTPRSALLPPFVQNAANTIAGRQVSIARVLISSTLILLSFITVIILAYTSARTAMTSLGRNPLAARAIHRGLYQVGGTALLVVCGALLVSYLILTI